MPELDRMTERLEFTDEQRTELEGSVDDLRNEFQYFHSVYEFWDDAPEFEEFDDMHSYLLEGSTVSPRSFETTLRSAEDSYRDVIATMEQRGVAVELNNAIESRPDEYFTNRPISLAFHDPEDGELLEKSVEMYTTLHDGGFYRRLSHHSADDLRTVEDNLPTVAKEYREEIRRLAEDDYRTDGGEGFQNRQDIKETVCAAGLVLSGAGAIGHDLLHSTGGASIYAGAGLIFSSGLT